MGGRVVVVVELTVTRGGVVDVVGGMRVVLVVVERTVEGADWLSVTMATDRSVVGRGKLARRDTRSDGRAGTLVVEVGGTMTVEVIVTI